MSPRVTPRAFLEALLADGRHSFTSLEAQTGLGRSKVGTQAVLRRLRAQGRLATPFRGFHVIVSPEYRRLGCPPAEQFLPQYLQFLGEPHYVGLLTAARYHGAGHHAAQVFQVMVAKPRRPLRCGQIRASFHVRNSVEQIATLERKAPRGPIRVSTPEATAVDLVGFPGPSGGLDNVATVLAELAGSLDPRRLSAAARHAPIRWAQRLGHLLDRVGHSKVTGPLARYVSLHATEYAPLSTHARVSEASPRDRRWRVRINAEVASEA